MARSAALLVALGASAALLAQSASATGVDVSGTDGADIGLSSGSSTVERCSSLAVAGTTTDPVTHETVVDHVLVGDTVVRGACAGWTLTLAVVTSTGVIETVPVPFTAGAGPLRVELDRPLAPNDVVGVGALLTPPTIHLDMTPGGDA